MVLVCVGGALFWFFRGSDSKEYLEKQTLYLLELARPVKVASDLAVVRRTQQIAGYCHFSLSLEVEVFNYHHRGKSLNHLRSLLMSYFKSPPLKSFKTPSREEVQAVVWDMTQAGEKALALQDLKGGAASGGGPVGGVLSPELAEKAKQVGKVVFPLSVVLRRGDSVVCEVQLLWVKEKDWLVHHIQLSRCTR